MSTPPTAARHPGRDCAFLALAWLVGIAWAWLLWDRFFSLMNFPYACAAAQVARGDVLYRDTMAIATPVSIWLIAVLMRVFGPTMTVARVAGAALTAVEAGLIWAVARRLGARPGWALVAALFVLVWGVSSGPVGDTVQSYVRLASFLATATVLCLLALPRRLNLLAAGALAAVALWTYQQAGIHLIAALGLWCLWQAVASWRRHAPAPGPSPAPAATMSGPEWLLLPVAGAALTSAPVILWALAAGVWQSMWNLVWRVPMLSGASYLFAWQDLLANLVRRGLAPGDLLHYARDGAPHPWALLGLLAVLAYWLGVRRRLDPRQSAAVAFVGLYASLGLLMCAWNPIPYRLFLHVLTPLGPLACWAVGDALGAGAGELTGRDPSARRRRAATLCAAVLFLFMLWGVARTAHEIRWRSEVRVETGAGPVWMTHEDREALQAARARIARRFPPGARCHILGRGGLLHLMTGTWPATPYSITTAVVFGPDQFGDYARILRAERPEVVFGAMRQTADLATSPFSDVLYSALTEHYELRELLHARIGEFTLWTLKRPPRPTPPPQRPRASPS